MIIIDLIKCCCQFGRFCHKMLIIFYVFVLILSILIVSQKSVQKLNPICPKSRRKSLSIVIYGHKMRINGRETEEKQQQNCSKHIEPNPDWVGKLKFLMLFCCHYCYYYYYYLSFIRFTERPKITKQIEEKRMRRIKRIRNVYYKEVVCVVSFMIFIIIITWS